MLAGGAGRPFQSQTFWRTTLEQTRFNYKDTKCSLGKNTYSSIMSSLYILPNMEYGSLLLVPKNPKQETKKKAETRLKYPEERRYQRGNG